MPNCQNYKQTFWLRLYLLDHMVYIGMQYARLKLAIGFLPVPRKCICRPSELAIHCTWACNTPCRHKINDNMGCNIHAIVPQHAQAYHILILDLLRLYTEKTIVLNMVRMAASGEIPSSKSRRPQTSDSDVHYVWAPGDSRTHKAKSSDHDEYLDDEDFKFSFQKEMEDNDRQGAMHMTNSINLH